MTVLRAAIGLLLALTCGCATGSQRLTRVLVVPVGEEGAAPVAEETMRRAIGRRPDLTLQGLSRLASLAAGEVEEAQGDPEGDARARLEAATEAFSRFDYVGATTQLDEALALLRPGAVRAAGRRQLAAVHLQRALVLLVHGERDAAVEQMRTCLSLDPACAPDRALHPPELLELFEEARSPPDGPRGVVEIDTEPSDARAELDGGRPTRTPASWDEVTPGVHYVALTRDGFRTEVVTVAVAAGQHARRTVVLRAGTRSERAAASLRQLQERGVETEVLFRATAAELGEADVLMVVRETGTHMTAGAFDVRGALLGWTHEGEADSTRRASRWLADVLPPPRQPWYGHWRFWVPVSVLVTAGVVTGVFLGLRTRNVQLVGGEVIRE